EGAGAGAGHETTTILTVSDELSTVGEEGIGHRAPQGITIEVPTTAGAAKGAGVGAGAKGLLIGTPPPRTESQGLNKTHLPAVVPPALPPPLPPRPLPGAARRPVMPSREEEARQRRFYWELATEAAARAAADQQELLWEKEQGQG
ncbi:unnamed protein product, partial [Discosporangium mesarthrocarpum]